MQIPALSVETPGYGYVLAQPWSPFGHNAAEEVPL
jgi:hypothetical protein